MTMSWLAEQNATASAHAAVAMTWWAGSVEPRPRIATMSAAWVTNAHDLRRPNHRVSNGIGT